MGRNEREQKLNSDLYEYRPRAWRINKPFKDYGFRPEDAIPALSGVIGKVALVAAFAVAWAAGLSVSDPTFVSENVRLELFVAGIITIVFSAVLNPYAGPPGTLAPLIPLIPGMAIAGVHPLPLAILIGLMGLAITLFKQFDKVIKLNGPGTKGGILLLFGLMGISSSLESLQSWTDAAGSAQLLFVLIAAGLICYILLSRLQYKWLIIPVCAAAAVIISSAFGLFPVFETGFGFPILSPDVWWNEKWAIGWGLNIESFLNAMPFAILAVLIWPVDALAITSLQEANYPKEAGNAFVKMNPTYAIASLRNIAGALLGGSQTAAIWRSFMIPLAVVKRPIGASALILGVLAIACGLMGFPIDIATFAPLLWMVLIFGIFIPLIEVGFGYVRSASLAQIALICIVGGIAVSPIVGWMLSVGVENFGIIKDAGSERQVTKKDRILTGSLLGIITAAYLVSSFI